MTSRYIRAQVLALTKAQAEREPALQGIANSVKRYGYQPPAVVYSDDPQKVLS
jgi:hypothetical protein